MKVRILTSGVGLGGRGKALLSLVDFLPDSFDVNVVAGDFDGEIFSFDYLCNHHGISPDVGWNSVDKLSESVLSDDVDVAIGWDSESNSLLHHFDCPTVAYCRRGISDWADEYWAPSQSAADRHNAWLRERNLEDNCRAVYPVWYLDRSDSLRPFDEREIDVLLHDRKTEGILDDISDYDVHVASDYSWDELTEVYENSKVFLFPNKARFEPLGLMVVEAAAFGCELSIARNIGAGEVYPNRVRRKPEEFIDELLESGSAGNHDIPESPTDPISQIDDLVSK